MTKYLAISVLLLFLYACNKKEHYLQGYDKIDSLITTVKNQNSYSAEVNGMLSDAYTLLNEKPNDSIKRLYMLKLSDQYYNFGLKDDYLRVCKLNLELSSKAKDSLRLGIIYNDIADYYRGKSFNDTAYIFYNKSLHFLDKNNFEKRGRAILNKAYLLRFENSLVESEIQTIKALEVAKQSGNKRLIYDCLNNLGIINNDIKNYDLALDYHHQALEQLNKLKSDPQYFILVAQTKNNMAVCYHRLQNNSKAITLLHEATSSKNLKNENILLYAVLIDNLTYYRFKSNQEVRQEDFDLPLKIRDSLDNKLGVIVSNTRKGEYFLSQNDTAKSVSYFLKAKEIAKDIKSHRDELLLLNFLAEAEPDKRLFYKEKYIQLSDSLMESERAVRNKFTRIEYETDEVIQQKEVLAKQQQFIVLTSISIILLLILTYIIFRQKAKQKELLLIQEQQKSNEEVYQLMIDQHHKVEEGRALEKNRISLELHDGTLSMLAGIRFNLYGFQTEENAEINEKFLNQVDQIKTVEKEIRNIAHDLKNNLFIKKESFLMLLNDFIEDQKIISKINYELQIDSEIEWESLSQSLKINFFRIIQEGVYNSQKYAQAKNISISIQLSKKNMELCVKDDGVGFNSEAKTKGIGLENIKQRVSAMEGFVKIKSINQIGTQIICKIPFHYEYQNIDDR
jgi:signal transduction histidine kinase